MSDIPCSSTDPIPGRRDPAEEAIEEFAAITGVDEALAHFFLQDYDFELQKGLNAYYRQQEREKTKAEKRAHESVDESDDDVVMLDAPDNTPKRVKLDTFPEDITVLSWNIDGLDGGNLETRLKGVTIIIAKENPEVILLQEVVHAHMDTINKRFGNMYCIVVPFDKGMPYFTVTMVSKNIVCRTQEVKPFGNTKMGRTMTVFDGYWRKLHLVVIHSHLESMREHAATRKAQFNECMKTLEKNIGSNTLVLFAGDLNIRDTEVGTLSPAVKDAWIAAGSDIKTKYTWDCKLNHNKGISPNVRCRFDRLYYAGVYKKVEFRLVGTSQINRIFCHPSDHFGIVCKFTEPIDK
uniref:Endo/exonuclease/phosphatase domain-containing protein n=1 Tax=Panagrellus redivivus TaxID=6233 RepID=A0A7E4VKJ9_PANRE